MLSRCRTKASCARCSKPGAMAPPASAFAKVDWDPMHPEAMPARAHFIKKRREYTKTLNSGGGRLYETSNGRGSSGVYHSAGDSRVVFVADCDRCRASGSCTG